MKADADTWLMVFEECAKVGDGKFCIQLKCKNGKSQMDIVWFFS